MNAMDYSTNDATLVTMDSDDDSGRVDERIAPLTIELLNADLGPCDLDVLDWISSVSVQFYSDGAVETFLHIVHGWEQGDRTFRDFIYAQPENKGKWQFIERTSGCCTDESGAAELGGIECIFPLEDLPKVTACCQRFNKPDLEPTNLTRAFTCMRRHGLVAQQRAGSDYVQIEANMQRRASMKRANGKAVAGWAGSLMFDQFCPPMERYIEIVFGDCEGGLAASTVGKIVCECLSENGVQYELDGEAYSVVVKVDTIRHLS